MQLGGKTKRFQRK